MMFFSFFFVAYSTKSFRCVFNKVMQFFSSFVYRAVFRTLQISKMESFAKPLATVSENAPSYMFDRVLNMPLVSVIVLQFIRSYPISEPDFFVFKSRFEVSYTFL